jgi:hypothetical protein
MHKGSSYEPSLPMWPAAPKMHEVSKASYESPSSQPGSYLPYLEAPKATAMGSRGGPSTVTQVGVVEWMASAFGSL